LNILHVIPTLDPAAGGPPRIALSLAGGAAELGHNVTLLSYDPGAARQRVDQQLDEIAGARLVHLHFLQTPSRFEKLTARKSRGQIHRLISGFDIVHIHTLWDAISMAAMGIARKRHIPYVLLVNGMLDPWSLSQRKLKKKIALALGVRPLLNHAAFLQAGNAGEKDCIANLSLASPIHIIPNGINPKQFEQLPARGNFYAAHPQLNGHPYILFLSRLHYKKGLDYLAETLAILAKTHADLQLVVAGPDDGARSDFETDIRNRQLQDRVHVLGPIFGPEKYSALQDALCFCLPSRQEGFSVAVLEAMACATPVVISNACHFPEVAAADAGEVVPLDALTIAAAIERILADPTQRTRMGDAARAMVYQHYTWPKIARQLIDAYQQCLASSPNDSTSEQRR
jgi:glycosyltransferase involved in cell wall biosynthesis